MKVFSPGVQIYCSFVSQQVPRSPKVTLHACFIREHAMFMTQIVGSDVLHANGAKVGLGMND